MTNVKCKKCKKEHDYKGKNKETWTCPDCRTINKLPAIIMAVVVSLAILSFGAVYSDQQVLQDLPFDRPFAYNNSSLSFYQDSGKSFVMFSPHYIWEITEEGYEKLPLEDDGTIPNDYEVFLEEIVPIVELNPVIKPDTDVPSAEDVEQTTSEDQTEEPTEPLTREEQIDECLRGIGVWRGIVPKEEIPSYVNKTRESYPQRDNLSNDVSLRDTLKAYQECIGKIKYEEKGYLNERNINIAKADAKGEDYLGRPENGTRGNEPSLGYKASNMITPEKMEKAQQTAIDYMCSEEGKQRGLHRGITCPNDDPDAPIPEHEKNRGDPNPLITDNSNTGIFLGNKTASQIDEEYKSAKAANIKTSQDIENDTFNNQVIRCKQAWNTADQGTRSTKWWPVILANGFCDDKLESDWLMKNSHNRFDNVKSARDYRLQLDEVIKEEFNQ